MSAAAIKDPVLRALAHQVEASTQRRVAETQSLLHRVAVLEAALVRLGGYLEWPGLITWAEKDVAEAAQP